MKLIVLYPVVVFLVLGPIGLASAQQRRVFLKLRDIRTDTVRKQMVFQYRLGNIAPKDSLSIELLRGNKAPFGLKAVYGDIGTILTDGKNKTIYWNPVADRLKIDSSSVAIRFTVKTVPGQGVTRRQTVNIGRWVIGTGVAAYTIGKGVGILNTVREYNRKEQPTSLAEKYTADAQRDAIQDRQRKFYRVAALSGGVMLMNIVLSKMQSRYKLKPKKLGVTNTNNSVGLTYRL